MLPVIDAVVNGFGKVLDKIVPDANVREQAKIELAEIALQANSQELERLKAENAERDSARKREMEVKDSTPSNGFYLLSAGFFGVLGYMLMWPVPPGSERVIDIMLGSLGTAWTAAVYYYYGTSHGSNQKTGIIDRIVNHKG